MVHPLLYVCSSTALWVSLYQHMCATSKRSTEWNCRLLSALHAVLLTSLSLFCAYYTGPWPFSEPGGDTTLFQELILALSLGYFIFDLAWCLSHKTEGVVMLVHHAASIMSLFFCVFYRVSGTELIAAIGGAEVTNPILQLRWFLRESGLKRNGLVINLVEYVFAAGFLFVRGVFGSYFLYCVTSHPRPSIFVKAGGVTIYIISMLFMATILRYLWRKQCKSYPGNQDETGKSDGNGESDRLKHEVKFVDSPVRFEKSKVR